MVSNKYPGYSTYFCTVLLVRLPQIVPPASSGYLGNNNVWTVTGFGSRGLLYHAWTAELLVGAIMTGDGSQIPTELIHKGNPGTS